MLFGVALEFCFKYLCVSNIVYGIIDNNWYFMLENLNLIFQSSQPL